MPHLRSLLLLALFTPSLVLAATATERKNTRSAAACAVNHSRAQSVTLAGAVPGSEQEKAAYEIMTPILATCLDRAKIANGAHARALIAGDIAERLYVAANISFHSRIVDPSELPETDRKAILKIIEKSRSTALAPPKPELAMCVVSHDPNIADALIRSRDESAAETKALNTIIGYLPDCIDRGQKLTIDRALLRADIARAFYRRSFATPVMSPVI